MQGGFPVSRPRRRSPTDELDESSVRVREENEADLSVHEVHADPCADPSQPRDERIDVPYAEEERRGESTRRRERFVQGGALGHAIELDELSCARVPEPGEFLSDRHRPPRHRTETEGAIESQRPRKVTDTDFRADQERGRPGHSRRTRRGTLSPPGGLGCAAELPPR